MTASERRKEILDVLSIQRHEKIENLAFTFQVTRRTTIITTTHSLEPHYEKKRFSVYNRDLHLFADWLISNNCFDLCMESTGKYWIPVFNILEERGIHVVIANPKWVKVITVF